MFVGTGSVLFYPVCFGVVWSVWLCFLCIIQSSRIISNTSREINTKIKYIKIRISWENDYCILKFILPPVPIGKYRSFVVNTEHKRSLCFSTAHWCKNYQIDVLGTFYFISPCKSVFLPNHYIFLMMIIKTHGGFGMEVLIKLI